VGVYSLLPPVGNVSCLLFSCAVIKLQADMLVGLVSGVDTLIQVVGGLCGLLGEVAA
jgi:hypothetical protein